MAPPALNQKLQHVLSFHMTGWIPFRGWPDSISYQAVFPCFRSSSKYSSLSGSVTRLSAAPFALPTVPFSSRYLSSRRSQRIGGSRRIYSSCLFRSDAACPSEAPAPGRSFFVDDRFVGILKDCPLFWREINLLFVLVGQPRRFEVDRMAEVLPLLQNVGDGVGHPAMVIPGCSDWIAATLFSVSLLTVATGRILPYTMRRFSSTNQYFGFSRSFL